MRYLFTLRRAYVKLITTIFHKLDTSKLNPHPHPNPVNVKLTLKIEHGNMCVDLSPNDNPFNISQLNV